MAEVHLELLTDEDIIDYTRSKGVDRVIVTHKDINLEYSGIHPSVGGLFDTDIFGSPFEDRCICGKIKQVSSEPCPNCGCRVYSREEALRRFARIELPFYYLNDLRFDIFTDFFEDVFGKAEIKLDFASPDLKKAGYSARSAKKLGMKAFDTCQFEYSEKKSQLTVSEFITDESKCSYEGLMAIIKKHFPGRLREYMRLINRYYLVMPAVMRPFSIRMVGKKKEMPNSRLTIWYSTIVYLCCADDYDKNPFNYNEVMSQLETPGERVRYTALLRAYINSGKKTTTELLNTSKKNFARDIYSVRVKNSARGPIVPSTTLAVDEIGIPRFMAYEMCREGFINYLVKELNFTKEEAMKSTKEEFNDLTLQKHFKDYAENQVVLNILVQR